MLNHPHLWHSGRHPFRLCADEPLKDQIAPAASLVQIRPIENVKNAPPVAAGWVGGIAEWQEAGTVYLSVAFTWKIESAYRRAWSARLSGLRVIAGGPALKLHQNRARIADVAEYAEHYQDAVARHNSQATFASRGCDQKCPNCIVPFLEGRTFTLIPDFPVRPILCDNNLSFLPADYQEYVIRRYEETRVPLLDANSGFEPRTFTPDVYHRWQRILRGPWRFAFDDMAERQECHRVMAMLSMEPPRKKRVYVLIGNEPYAECMQRISEVIANGCEPHVQPVMKLNAMTRQPWVRFDWTEQKLKDVARWANGFVWRSCPRFEDYDRYKKNAPTERYDEQQGLFV